ncbi:hypothetical protein E2C01_086566 [Portunus trituberculatus]|uniref:Uncharacterized protein n=1 Tax=Portunus trituberculatus TaxID=210409 RepID=A0A5B7JAN8_PORTR|nr:hypothetical protein [Portunus trituberculatus]
MGRGETGLGWVGPGREDQYSRYIVPYEVGTVWAAGRAVHITSQQTTKQNNGNECSCVTNGDLECASWERRNDR